MEPNVIICKKIAWKVKNFSALGASTTHHSKAFTVGDCSWTVALNKSGQDGKSLALFLNLAYPWSLPPDCSVYANTTLMVTNQYFRNKRLKADLKERFFRDKFSCGCPNFIDLNMLQEPSSGYIVNDVCVVEVEFFEVRYEGLEFTSHHLHSSLSTQVPSNYPDDGDYVEFKDLGRIDKALVPLLEEACSRHPSLMDCKNYRSRLFTEWAFTALGEVLQFLENKWDDMDEEACEQLQRLWQELEMTKLDLTWLEPRFKSAIGMKEYMEKGNNVKKLKTEAKS